MSELITDKAMIREILRQNRGSAKEVAKLAGVKHSTFSMWLHDRSPSFPLDTKVPALIKKLKLKLRSVAA